MSTASKIESLEQRRLLAAVTTYLSDLTPAVTPTNGWGPIEKDHSNGEIAAGDGKTITLNGTTYAKGLGVHAASEVDYDIQAVSGYTDFLATVGVDDEVGSNGSVVFQVWFDSQKLFDSGTLAGANAGAPVDVNIAGKTGRLRLLVTDAGNGKDYDHADWADARLFATASTPVVSLTRNSGGDISENGGSAGFIFTRQGSTSDPLTVNFSAGGVATRGTDYQLRLGDSSGQVFTGSTVTIPAGATSVLITATTINDSVLESKEDIILSVDSGSGYNVGGPNTASVGIIDDDQSAGFAYLSDLPINSAANGWGPIELDHSNGETGAHDGHTLTLNGTTYAKGLGVHANSEVIYNLDGSYNTFQAVIGVDDEVGNNGSVDFQVFANSVKVYDSGTRTGSQAGLPISVDINGATQLRLVVTDAGNGNAYDHADWADAKVSAVADYGLGIVDRSAISITEGGSERFIISLHPLRNNTGPLSFDYETYDITTTAGKDYTPVSGHVDVPAGTSSDQTYNIYVQTLNDNIPEGQEQFGLRLKNIVGSAQVSPDTGTLSIASNVARLSHFTPVSATNGWGPIEVDQSNGEAAANDGHPITVNGSIGSGGLGVHANSDVTYNIANLGANTLSGFVGVDDEVGSKGSVVFQIYVDGTKKFDSGLMTGNDGPKNFSVAVGGASTVRLVVTDGGNGKDYDHADWAGLSLSL